MLQRHWSRHLYRRFQGVLQLHTVLYLFQWLQSVQNTVARLITWTGRRDYISRVPRELYWLLVWRRVDFKLAILTFKSLHGQAVQYLSEKCQLVPGCQSLTTVLQLKCVMPLTRTRLGDKSFAVTGPRIWNTLPASLCLVDDWVHFKRLLKAHLFDWGCEAKWLFCFRVLCIKSLTYLFTYLLS